MDFCSVMLLRCFFFSCFFFNSTLLLLSPVCEGGVHLSSAAGFQRVTTEQPPMHGGGAHFNHFGSRCHEHSPLRGPWARLSLESSLRTGSFGVSGSRELSLRGPRPRVRGPLRRLTARRPTFSPALETRVEYFADPMSVTRRRPVASTSMSVPLPAEEAEPRRVLIGHSHFLLRLIFLGLLPIFLLSC